MQQHLHKGRKQNYGNVYLKIIQDEEIDEKLLARIYQQLDNRSG